MSLIFLPQTALFGGALLTLMVGVFSPRRHAFGIASIVALLVIALTTWLFHMGTCCVLPSFITSNIDFGGYTRYFSQIILMASGIGIFAHLVSGGSKRATGLSQFEYPVLILLSTLGMTLLVASKTLMGVYVALELQSLALYVMIAMKREHVPAIEASLKYFMTGALSTGFLLLGMSFLYGAGGDLSLGGLQTFIQGHPTSPMIVLGLGLLLTGFLFKISAAPFHMWTPDVYEGSPTAVTFFMATAAKAAAFGVLLKLLVTLFLPLGDALNQGIMAVVIVTMILGTLGALAQTSVKRLFAFSTVSHVGFILMPLIGLGNQQITMGGSELIPFVSPSIFYITIYVLTAAGSFIALLAVKNAAGRTLESFEDLKGLSQHSPFTAFALSVLMLSMAGIPPLGGFFAKFAVLQQALAAGHVTVALVAIVASVIACGYYLKVIRMMYFETADHVLAESSFGLRLLLGGIVGILILFALLLPNMLALSGGAAQALWG